MKHSRTYQWGLKCTGAARLATKGCVLFLLCLFQLPATLKAAETNAPDCTFVLSPLARNHSAIVSTGVVSVATAPECVWLARTTNFWITVLSPVTNIGSGTVFYRLTPNGSVTRTGSILVAGQNFTVIQTGNSNTPPNCTFTLTPASQSHS